MADLEIRSTNIDERDAKITTEDNLILKQKAAIKALTLEINIMKHELEKLNHTSEKDSLEINIMKRELEKMKQDSEKYSVEIGTLNEELTAYKDKLNNITKARVNKRNVEEMDLMEKFFRDYLVAKKGAAVKTVDVMTKANDVLATDGIRFNKFEVAKFMKDKGIIKKKTGPHSYYQDIKFV